MVVTTISIQKLTKIKNEVEKKFFSERLETFKKAGYTIERRRWREDSKVEENVMKDKFNDKFYFLVETDYNDYSEDSEGDCGDYVIEL